MFKMILYRLETEKQLHHKPLYWDCITSYTVIMSYITRVVSSLKKNAKVHLPQVCLNETIDSNKQIISALLWPLLGNGEDWPIDVLGIRQDVISWWSSWFMIQTWSRMILGDAVTKHWSWWIQFLRSSFDQHLDSERTLDLSMCVYSK